MGKVLGAIAVVAGIIALTIALPGVGTAIGISAATAATVSSVAAAVSVVASAAAYALQEKPKAQGTVSQVMIGQNMPIPYAMGRTYLGGNMIYDKSTNGPDNYDRVQIMVYSSCGPIDSFESFLFDYNVQGFSGADFMTSRVATGFYGADGGYAWLNCRKGECPDTALTAHPGRAAFEEWTTNHKLSGYAAAALTMEFDEDGKRWASGIPQHGMIAKWVKVYDPRLDSTYPGGSGTQRWDDETTWAWSANPGLHGLAYARGRYRGSVTPKVKIVGAGIPKEAIDIAAFVELANLCDANGWVIGGAVYEGLDFSKWQNLKRILIAGGAEPVWVGGLLTLRINQPVTSLTTITVDDLADQEVQIRTMKPWRDKYNTIIPRYRSEANRWEYVQSAAVTSSTYTTEDGEVKSTEIQYDLVQNKDQASELAAYDLVNGREFGPIQLACKPRMIEYRPGEGVTVNLPEAGLVNQLCVIIGRRVDPLAGVVYLTLNSETTAKHAFALGQTGTAPPSPTLWTSQDVDDNVSGSNKLPSPATVPVQVEWDDKLVLSCSPIAHATSYRWRFYLSDGTTLKRTIITTFPQVEYTRNLAHLDGISRSYKVDVAGVNANGTGTVSAKTSTLTKAAPATVTGVAFADGTSTSTVTFTTNGALGYRIAWSTSSGFNPQTQGSSITALTSPAYTSQLPAASYFGKVAAFDAWTSQPDQLNFSTQDAFTITPGTGGSPSGGDGGGGFEGGGGGGGGHLP